MDQQDVVQELSVRIGRLERQNRRLSFALLALAAAGVALLAGAVKADTKDVTLEATRFVLKDSAGEVKGKFLVGPDGAGAIVLFGADGEPVARLPLQPQAFPAGR
jgi:hypothetical protein